VILEFALQKERAERKKDEEEGEFRSVRLDGMTNDSRARHAPLNTIKRLTSLVMRVLVRNIRGTTARRRRASFFLPTTGTAPVLATSAIISTEGCRQSSGLHGRDREELLGNSSITFSPRRDSRRGGKTGRKRRFQTAQLERFNSPLYRVATS
jgi:hypothetical protein